MKSFVPKEKLSKKARKELNSKERRTWEGINPVTRKVESKKLYNRKKTRTGYEDYLPGSFLYYK